MSKIISYSIEEILSYKNVNINILTEELSNIFDSINNSFLQSTQYLENRKKINYNQINSSKWKKINSNINTKLLSLLNKITDETFSNILEKILNSNIINNNQLNILSDDIMYKIINDTDNNKLYCSLIKKIIDSGLWYFKNEEKDYINFRIYFIEKLEKEFKENINNIELLNETYISNEDEYFNIKKKLTSLINTIINLHLMHVLSDQVMDHVVDKLKEKYSLEHPDAIEFLYKINEIHNYEDVTEFLKQLLKENIPNRLKFMIENINNPVIKVEKNINVIDEYKKFLIDGNLDLLKKNVNNKLVYLDLLKFLFNKLVSVNLNEIDKYLNLIKKVKDKMNKDEYEQYLEENMDDILEELPILSKFKDRL